MSDQYDEEYDEEFVDESEIAAILADYHRKQMLENMTGPAISLIVHAIILTLMFIFVVKKPLDPPPEYKVEIKPVEVKEPPEPPEIEQEKVPEEVIEEEMEVEELSDNPQEEVGEVANVVDVNDDAPQTDDSADMEAVNMVKMTNSPMTIAAHGGRTEAGRAGNVKKYGGSKAGQQSVAKALRWLAKVQNPDGSWGPEGKGEPAPTGLGLLVFLAHGETPLSEKYGKTVRTAIKWLSEQMMEKGNLGGKAYAHGIATYALAEAYGMTQIPFVKDAMEKGIQVIIDGQLANGGYAYSYAKVERWDQSVGGWNWQALKASYVAGASNQGLAEAIKKSIRHNQTVSYNPKGAFGYASSANNANPKTNMNGIGVVALQLLGKPKAPQVQKTIDESIMYHRLDLYKEVLKDPSKWTEVGGKNLYGWYYDTQAIFNNGGANWKQWRPVFERVLIKAQHTEGYWEVHKGHGQGPSLNGRIHSTCWAALQLEVYYRYLPTFDMNVMEQHKVNMDDEGGLEGAVDDNEGVIIEIE